MRKLVLIFLLVPLLTIPVSGEDFTAPPAPPAAEGLVPATTDNFSEDLWKVILGALERIEPEIMESVSVCACVVALMLLTSLLNQFPGQGKAVLEFGACIAIGLLLVGKSGSMIRLASNTVRELSEYGKLLLPAMTAALAAQGGTTTAAGLYAGTVALDVVVAGLICNILVPAVYIYLALSIAHGFCNQEGVGRLSGLLKWFGGWSLKTVLYLFTGYLGITGVVSTTADAAALKATKLSISGVVPVVGGILSDASEAVLLGAGVVKNGVGIYGLLVIAAIWSAPFFQIGALYLVLKITGALCSGFALKAPGKLMQSFCSAMGLLLAMIGTMSMLLLISTLCFMKGVG